MPNHGSMYGEKKEPLIKAYVTERGIVTDFEKGWKKFWSKRGIEVDEQPALVKQKQKLSDPFLYDYHSLKKAIEYGRSYRKDAE